MDWHTTSTLLERLSRFDEQDAWRTLVERFQGPVEALARRLGLPAADAQDVAQETLLAFARSFEAGKFERDRGRLKHWLFGIARRQIAHAVTRRRSEAQRASSLDAFDGLESTAAGELEALWEEEWRRGLYQRALRRIQASVSPETFHVFRLTVAEGLSAGEVCARLGVSRATVYNVKHRLARRIGELLAELEDE
jgi:RNA polymerase sigma-70 factor (ECF subfamily)